MEIKTCISYNKNGGDELNSDKLKGKLKEKKKTYEHCAQLMGTSVTTLNNKINGHSKFYIEEIEKLSIILELTTQEKIDIFLS